MIYDLQKASVSKRIAAFLLDAIIVTIIATACMAIISPIVGVDGKIDELYSLADSFKAKYELDVFDENDIEKISALIETNEEAKALYMDYNSCGTTATMLTFVPLSLGLFIGTFITAFVMPLFFKNGQTVGKKIFGIAVMRKDGVKVNNFVLFVRSVLGVYTIETMIPALLIWMAVFLPGYMPISLSVLAVILLLQIVFFVVTKAHTPIHDMIASAVTVDITSQMIFESVEEREEYIKKAQEKYSTVNN